MWTRNIRVAPEVEGLDGDMTRGKITALKTRVARG
jgi:hypothetical protein